MITVILPTYNAEKTIERALHSIFTQNYLPDEIIIIDDASQDNTVKVIQQFIIQHEVSNWHLIQLPQNQGPAVARNTGIQSATAEFIAFLDADDEWLPWHLAKGIKMIRENKLDLFGAELSFSPPHPTFADIDSYKNQKLVLITPFNILLRNPFYTPTVILRRDRYLKMNTRQPTSSHYSEDYHLWLKFCLNKDYRCARSAAIHGIYDRGGIKNTARLSSNYWQMRKAELSNYWQLYQQDFLGFFAFCFASFFCLLIRHPRRVFLNWLKNNFGNRKGF